MAAPYGNPRGKVYHVTNIEKDMENSNLQTKGLIYDRIKAFEIYKKDRKSIILYHPNLFPALRETPQDSSASDIAKPMSELALSESKKTEENVKCCFFSTTLFKVGLPTITPYPPDGKIGTSYKRIRFPFEVIFESYPICWFWCAVDIQVHYICGREDQQNDIEKAILNGYKDKTNKEWNNKLTKVENEYLKENKKENEPVEINERSKEVDIKTKYIIIYKDKTENILPKIQNEYASDKIFYNIAVCGDVLFVDEVRKTM